jgi:hypothetical protein
MEKRTEGAWIIHHTKKIQEVTRASDFEDVELAGKCGLFLSSLAASNEESTLSSEKISAIAKASSIKKVELATIKATLKAAHLIDTSNNGDIAVVGITTSNVLSHTAQIFEESTSDNFQKASLELTNYSSDHPINENLLKEYISDKYRLHQKLNSSLFQQAEEIGIIDYENFDSEKVYFNGNLFKKDTIEKTTKVLSSLSSEDSRKITEVNEILIKEGCIPYETAVSILGNTLLSKLQSIAMYDFNEVSNEMHSKVFLTKPSSFSKFGNPFEDDALDMAKAFISSLIYGMHVSTYNRGKLQSFSMLRNTLLKLLRGERVGPCTAIGQDYQVLELNRVVQLEQSNGTRFYMRLLKFDIGKLALNVLENGDLAEQTTLDSSFTTSKVSNYSGPEKNRMKIRRKKDTSENVNVGELLRTMRQ